MNCTQNEGAEVKATLGKGPWRKLHTGLLEEEKAAVGQRLPKLHTDT